MLALWCNPEPSEKLEVGLSRLLPVVETMLRLPDPLLEPLLRGVR